MSIENINWLEEVTKRQDDLLADLFRLLKVRSVREDDKATPEAPVGPGPKAALDEFVQMAKEDGFEVEEFGPWAAHVEIGQGEDLVGVLGHVDVVPEGSGWETDPYEPQIIDGRIYARGSSDDKGPFIGAYFATKLLRELGVDFNQRLRLIAGTDEESGWQCMDHYFQEAEMPDYGFSPDATFPIINGEKGNVSAVLTMDPDPQDHGSFHLVEFKAGLRENMVPQDAYALIRTEDLDIVKADVETFLDNHPEISGRMIVEDAQHARIEITGKAAHGSTPEEGINAATYLARLMLQFSFDDYDLLDWLNVVGREIHLSTDGKNLGLDYEHPVMGALSMNLGIMDYDDQKGGRMVLNFRYPEGITPEEIQVKLEDLVEDLPIKVELGEGKEPHYVPADDPLVATLLEVYENQTGQEGHEQTIGGGTYARLMPRGVAYGALFPDSIDVMHQANEFISVDDLLRATAIYAEAIYRLTR